MAQTYADSKARSEAEKAAGQTSQSDEKSPSASDAEQSPSDAKPSAEDQNDNAAAFVGKTVADMERDLIISTLDHCLGNRTHAAKILGISIRTLRNKINQYTDEGVAVPGS